RVHKRGDLKEYFRAEQDVWQMFRTILRERKRREIDPVLAALYECRDLTSVAEASTGNGSVDSDAAGGVAGPSSRRSVRSAFAASGAADTLPSSEEGSLDVTRIEFDAHNDRLDAMLEFMELIDKLADRFVSRDGNGLRTAAGILGKVI
ncbi:MAG: hypothetical protein ACOC0P_06200, partial [Planctomycetota bacterium]